MTAHYMQTLFTPEVVDAQRQHSSDEAYARAMGHETTFSDALGAREALFISTRDTFFLASTSSSGWPYVQHRGGPVGFLKVLDERRIAFADYRGNRQYISLGNVTADDRVALFFMDFTRRARLKLLGHMRVVHLLEEPDIARVVVDSDYNTSVERGFVIAVEAFDWNCPQHIVPRYAMGEIEAMAAPLKAKIAALESELEALKSTTGIATRRE